ncbi:MAG: hypothetical protein WD250_13890 [Egibacteraceae bacterium]
MAANPTTTKAIARDLAALYALTFGGFDAFGAYLPTYLTKA